MIKRLGKIFISYFPAILLAGQILTNLLYFFDRSWYEAAGFYLNLMFGTNVLFAVFLIVFTYTLKFCSVSRWAAWAQLLFAVNYIIVQQDNLYNILFQVVVGCVAMSITLDKYLKKFPLCRASLLVAFIRTVIEERSCTKGIENWKQSIIKSHVSNSNR
jgi:hypothetical protein